MYYTFKGYSVVTDCMTEACEESQRNQPYFQHIISKHLAIEKTICNRKKIIAHGSELVCFRKSHQTWRCNVYYLKSCACFFTRRGHIDPPPPRLNRVKEKCEKFTIYIYNYTDM